MVPGEDQFHFSVPEACAWGALNENVGWRGGSINVLPLKCVYCPQPHWSDNEGGARGTLESMSKRSRSRRQQVHDFPEFHLWALEENNILYCMGITFMHLKSIQTKFAHNLATIAAIDRVL